VKIESPPQ